MMKPILLGLLLACLALPARGQSRAVISGLVRDAASGEALVNATISAPALRKGAYTNTYGFYSLSLSGDSAELVFSYVGYQPQRKRVSLTRDLRLDVALEAVALEEVVITDNLVRQNVEKPQMGVIDLPLQQIEALPYITGEKDVLKAIQLLPGVQSTGEAASGFLVRGGNPDQNLVLMDEAIVYNPFHLAGYVSIFNSDAIRNVNLYKGSFPARFGGRLSSILDISMKEGNNREFHGEGGLGVVSAKFTFEGPILRDRASFMLSARRFYWDQVVRPFLPFGVKTGYNFTDLNGKVNFQLSDRDRIYLSGYYGGDNLYDERLIPTVDTTRFRIGWGNSTVTLRWNHLFGNRMFVNTSVIFSDYLFGVEQYVDRISARVQSGVRDWNVKTDFEFTPSPSQKITFGVSYIYHRFTPNSSRGSSLEIPISLAAPRYAHEAGLYVNDEVKIGERLGLNLGLRLPLFYGDSAWYYGLEPRATLSYLLGPNTSVKGGYTLMNQFAHLVSTSAISLPFDLWVPSSRAVKPQRAQQVALGLFQNWFEDRYESSLEVYYKRMDNLIDYREGANFFFNNDIEQELVFGRGWAYGAELFMRKRKGRFNGWLGYTLAWSWRQFDELNQGRPYFAKYDRRHDFELAAFYRFNEHWSFSAVFVYSTGTALTLPEGRLYVPGQAGWVDPSAWFLDYTSKNGYRMKAYHRMDLGLHYHKRHARYDSEVHIDIYNAYNRRNPFFVYLDLIGDARANATRFTATQVSLLPVIPSIAYFFKF